MTGTLTQEPTALVVQPQQLAANNLEAMLSGLSSAESFLKRGENRTYTFYSQDLSDDLKDAVIKECELPDKPNLGQIIRVLGFISEGFYKEGTKDKENPNLDLLTHAFEYGRRVIESFNEKAIRHGFNKKDRNGLNLAYKRVAKILEQFITHTRRDEVLELLEKVLEYDREAVKLAKSVGNNLVVAYGLQYIAQNLARYGQRAYLKLNPLLSQSHRLVEKNRIETEEEITDEHRVRFNNRISLSYQSAINHSIEAARVFRGLDITGKEISADIRKGRIQALNGQRYFIALYEKLTEDKKKYDKERKECMIEINTLVKPLHHTKFKSSYGRI